MAKSPGSTNSSSLKASKSVKPSAKAKTAATKKSATKAPASTSKTASKLAAKAAAAKDKMKNVKPATEAEQMTLQNSPHDYSRPVAPTLPALSEEDRQLKVQNAAYLIAERDGFQAGREQEYWFQAEREIAEQMRAQTNEQMQAYQPKPRADIPNDIH